MPDNPDKTDYRDRNRVAGDEDYEVRHFAEEAGITVDQARTLIKRHGNDRKTLHAMAESIRRTA